MKHNRPIRASLCDDIQTRLFCFPEWFQIERKQQQLFESAVALKPQDLLCFLKGDEKKMSYRRDFFFFSFFLGFATIGASKVENHQLAPGFNCQGKRVTGARGAYLLISCIGSKQPLPSLPSRLCRLCLRPQIRLCGGLLLQRRL